MADLTKDLGAASIDISLSHGRLTVTHNTENEVLKDFDATPGTWFRIWDLLEQLEKESVEKYKQEVIKG